MYKISRLAKQSLHSPHRMERTYEEHVKILEAMKVGKAGCSADLTVEHMDNQYNINIKYIQEGN